MNSVGRTGDLLPSLVRLLLCLVALSAGCAARGETPPARPFRVVGYLPYYRFSRFDMEQAGRLTDIVLFAARARGNGELDLSSLDKTPWEALRSLPAASRPRLQLCVINGSREDGFSQLTSSAPARERFVQEAVHFCRLHHLSGLDLDWEFPRGEAEQEAYARLLMELRKAFRPHQFTISVAMSPSQQLPASGFDAVDWVHVMAYDHGARHSTMDHARQDLDLFLKRGVPASRLVLGLPFYGRDIENFSRSIPYQRLVQKYSPAADVDEAEGIYFNNHDTIAAKTRHAWECGCAGVMIWEIGQDAPGEEALLNTVDEVVQSLRHNRSTAIP